MIIFKNDAFTFNYHIELENKKKYIFTKNDSLLVIIYNKFNKNEYIAKEFNFEKEQTDIEIYIESEKMKQLNYGDYILEIKLINKDIYTTLQEDILIKKGWCK